MRTVTWVGRNLWMAFLVLVAGLVSPTLARDLPGERESLAGLAGVYVSVEPMDPDVEREGLARSTLQTDVELKLRQAGIRVLTEAEVFVAPGFPHLYLRVGTVRGSEWPLYAFEILLELRQRVMLARKPTIALDAPTWRTSSVGSVGNKNLNRVREPVRDQVDAFINAYLAANPKQ